MTQPKANSNSIGCSMVIVQLLCCVTKMIRKKTKLLMFSLRIRLEEDETCLMHNTS